VGRRRGVYEASSGSLAGRRRDVGGAWSGCGRGVVRLRVGRGRGADGTWSGCRWGVVGARTARGWVVGGAWLGR